MNENINALTVIAQGVKDKFLTVCFGALFVTVFYVALKDIIRPYIIIENAPVFTYLAVIIMLLAFTAVAHISYILYKLSLAFIIIPICKEVKIWFVVKGLFRDLSETELRHLADYLDDFNVNVRDHFSKLKGLKKYGFISNYSKDINGMIDTSLNIPSDWNYTEHGYLVRKINNKLKKSA